MVALPLSEVAEPACSASSAPLAETSWAPLLADRAALPAAIAPEAGALDAAAPGEGALDAFDDDDVLLPAAALAFWAAASVTLFLASLALLVTFPAWSLTLPAVL